MATTLTQQLADYDRTVEVDLAQLKAAADTAIDAYEAAVLRVRSLSGRGDCSALHNRTWACWGPKIQRPQGHVITVRMVQALIDDLNKNEGYKFAPAVFTNKGGLRMTHWPGSRAEAPRRDGPYKVMKFSVIDWPSMQDDHTPASFIPSDMDRVVSVARGRSDLSLITMFVVVRGAPNWTAAETAMLRDSVHEVWPACSIPAWDGTFNP